MFTSLSFCGRNYVGIMIIITTTYGSMRTRSEDFFEEICLRLVDKTRNQNAGSYFAPKDCHILRGNGASILGTKSFGQEPKSLKNY